jgi:hypothetical protein
MLLFHGDAPAAVTDKFHRRQLILAYMSGIHFRGTAETAFGLVSAGVAQMPRIVGYGTAIFTRIGHDLPPLVRKRN